MRPVSLSLLALATAAIPFALAAQQAPQTGPNCEDVFKNIKVFKGVPAKDLIPAMEFMAGALKFKCSNCHDEKDFAAETNGKSTARRMITMQREINQTYFGGRLSVTCMTCHNGREHPALMPLPEGATLRHARIQDPPKVDDVLQKHLKAVGTPPPLLTFTGTQVAPTDKEGKGVAAPVTMIQAADGRFKVDSTAGKFGFDGKGAWRDGFPLTDEPAAIFMRMGRSWRGDHAFDGLERLAIGGKETLGKTETTVVRGVRTATGSTEELYFDNKSGLLTRFVNMTRSSLGTVVTVYDYSGYRSVKGVKVPMNVNITFAGDEKWTMTFKSAKAEDKVDDTAFAMGGK